jgi:hypothetical protein
LNAVLRSAQLSLKCMRLHHPRTRKPRIHKSSSSLHQCATKNDVVAVLYMVGRCQSLRIRIEPFDNNPFGHYPLSCVERELLRTFEPMRGSSRREKADLDDVTSLFVGRLLKIKNDTPRICLPLLFCLRFETSHCGIFGTRRWLMASALIESKPPNLSGCAHCCFPSSSKNCFASFGSPGVFGLCIFRNSRNRLNGWNAS